MHSYYLRGCVTPLFLSVLLAFTSQGSLCHGQGLIDVASFGVNIGTVAVDGTRGVFNEGTRVRVMDITDPANPIFQGSVDVGAVPTSLFLIGTTAYSAAVAGNFHIIDISNASSPKILGTVAGECWANASWIRPQQDFAYLAEAHRITIIDIRNKSNPFVVRRITEGQRDVFSITGDDSFLYAADSDGVQALLIWDLTNPVIPIRVGGLDIQGNARAIRNSLVIVGNTVYMGQFDGTIAVDVTDRTSPQFIKRLSSDDEVLALDNNILHTGRYGRGEFYNLADPKNPTLSGSTHLYAPGPAGQLAAQGEFDYSARQQTLYITNISGAVPQIVVTHAVTPELGSIAVIARKDNFIFAGGGPGLITIDISDPLAPSLINRVDSRVSNGIEIQGNRLYNLTWGSVLETWDITDPAGLVKLDEDTVRSGDGGLDVVGSRAVAVNDGEIRLFDIDANGLLTQRAIFTPPGRATSVSFEGPALYVLTESGFLSTYDATDISNPFLKENINLGSAATETFGGELQIIDGELHVLLSRRGYFIVDISQPLNPAQIAEYRATDVERGGIVKRGAFIYLATFGWCGRRGIRVLNISDLSAIEEIQAVDGVAYVQDILEHDGFVYTAEAQGGLRVRQIIFPPAAARPHWTLYDR